MECLCFVNGRNQDEMVRIFEGDFYEIDRLTSKYIDSDAIRKKYKKQFEEFQARYPHAKNGAVRIYGDQTYSENGQRVLYKKHKVAFNHIIKDIKFLRWSSKKDLVGEKSDRLISDTYVLNGIVYYNKEITRMNQFLSNLKKEDRKKHGITGGGSRYYWFVRALLNRYEEYRKEFNKPSLEDIWKEHLKKLEHVKIERHSLISSKDVLKPSLELEMGEVVPSEEFDVDRIYYELEPIVEEPLYDFFVSADFERYFSHLFRDEELVIVGDFNDVKKLDRLQPYKEVADRCYNGTCLVGTTSEFIGVKIKNFNDANIVVVYGEVDTNDLRIAIIRAIENKTDVVFISDNIELINMYAKKFNCLVTILDNEEKHISAKKQLADFFVKQYVSKKGHQK